MIKKQSLRDQVKKYLLNEMLKGKISFGARLSLPTLAKHLDISVTPIRECLTQLQQAHIVEAIPNRGFFLPNLNIEEAKNIYPIIASLESLAITSASYTEKQIQKLKQLHQELQSTTDPHKLTSLDMQFHDIMLQHCPNDLLLQMISDLKVRVFLYEAHFMAEGELQLRSQQIHQDMIAALSGGQLKKAAVFNSESWYLSEAFIISALKNYQN